MEALLSLQDELYDNLMKAERNFKKTSKERIKRQYLETRLELLEQLFKDFKDGHKEVVARAKGKKESYFTEGKYEIFEELYVQYKSSLREALQQFLPSVTELPSPAVYNSANNNCSDIKLPRIQLPTFEGRYEEWPTFYDMFSSLIHNNKNISSVQKLHYLKSNLSGEALNLLSNFSTTDANYEEAWKQLVRRYNNKRYNCNAVMRTLFGTKKIQTESANAIRSLLDTTSTCLKSLENLGISTESSYANASVVYLVVSKLDTESVKQWEQQLNMKCDELPTWIQLRDYLEYRFRTLEMIDTNGNRAAQQSKSAAKSKSFHASLEKDKENKSKSKQECPMCHEIHYLNQCKRFNLMTPKQRQDFVQTSKLCFNCLSSTHAVVKCRQSFSCKKCGRRHHTMLHFERENQEPASSLEKAAAASSSEPKQDRASTTRGDTHITTTFSRGELQPNSVLLATAKVKVFRSNGFKHIIRALLDQGSQASFVSESTVQLLGLVRKPVSGWVSGLGDGRMRIKNTVTLRLESRHNPASYILVNAYVLHSLTSLLPSTNVSTSKWLEIDKLPLADPTYSTPGRIDILLGAEVYSEILLDGVMKHPDCNLIAQNTVFGWILSGRVSKGYRTIAGDNLISMHVHMKEDELLKRFWEMEDEPNLIKKEMTNSEKVCEDFFDSTTVRDDEGRFIVRLPFATDDPKCQYGNTEVRAVKRLENLERKLSKDLKLREEYNRVMSEYLSMDHMRLVSESELQKSKAVYLPHHAVVREDKDTTKVRVVFDASSKGDNSVSLNDELLVGPRLQQDLRHILMRWRHHKVCIVADIIKMYRMVRVADKDTDFQRIVWRFDPSEPIKRYKLLRLTFGTACAPYLAVKVLHRLAELEEKRYPLAAAITKQCYYMDDLMTGSDTVSEAIKIYEEMNELMRSGGFELQKWNSNNERFLERIGKNESSERQTIKLNDLIKVLGLSWNRKNDNFEYVINLPEPKDFVTKRQVLSEVARLYDPLGWIAPVVVNAKILIQKLWKSGFEWDDCLTDEILDEWEDNVPPAKWLLGKIIKKFPGPDNVTRVVSIKCKTGEYRRPVSKICILTK
ncbi:unnamed protein product [Euphydryas editha]|uniref:Reverse transcriptase domain-containing protein n=1 Tax=Euphydryas editha TaxID=104508 RepID=A0AAU9TC29_EUPED|nr:unnamed protein product [Euphydryas editha]